jgi:DNA-binding beta-propeller fold protein YncE
MKGATRRSRYVTASVAIVLTLLLAGLLSSVALSGGPSSHPSPAATLRASTLSEGDRSVESPLPTASAPGATVATLTLFNNTLAAGNFLPNNTYYPLGVAYDSRDRTAWFTSGNNVGVANATTAQGIAILPSAGAATGIVYDNRSDRVFASNSASNTVTVFDGLTNTKIGTVVVGYDPDAVAYDWETNQVYVTQVSNTPGFENVTVINATSLAIVAGIPVGAEATADTYVATTHAVWVVNYFSENITIVDPATLTTDGSIPLYGGEPKAAVFDPENGLVYVANAGLGVEIFDPATNTSVGNISYSSVGTDPSSLAVDPALHTLYVTNGANGTVSAVDTNGEVVAAQTGLGLYSQPESAAYDPADHRVLVACEDGFEYASSNITEISTATNSTVDTIPIELLPEGAVYDGATHSIYTYDGGSGRVDQINDSTDLIQQSVFVGYTPHTIGLYVGALALDGADGELYVSHATPLSGGVSVVNLSTFTVVQNLPSTDVDGPAGIAYDAADGHMFIANYYNDSVLMVNAHTGVVLSATLVGDRPIGVTYDPANGQVFVADSYDDTMSILNGSTGDLVGVTGVGTLPISSVYDPTNHDVYVVNSETANLTAISSISDASVANITIRDAGYPDWASFDPVNQSLEVTSGAGADEAPGYLSVVSTLNQSFVGNILVGSTPGGTVFDAAQNETFVPNYFPGSLSVVRIGPLVAPPPLQVTALVAVPPTIHLGNATDLETSTTGGTPPLTYTYSTLPSGCITQNLSTLPCTPTVAGVYSIGVNVTDSASGHGSATTVLTVLAPAGSLRVALTATPASIDVGQPTTLQATPSGGTPPYSYAYSSLPPGCTTANTSDLPCTPSSGGTYSPTVVVSDSGGHQASNTTVLVVTSGGPVLAVTLTLTPAAVPINTSSQLLTVATGGTAPYAFAYSGLPAGCVSPDEPVWNCTATSTGIYLITVTVTDDSGQHATATATLTVTAAGRGPNATTTTTTGIPWWGWVIVAIAAALVLFFFFAARRRKKEALPDTHDRPSVPTGTQGSPPPSGPIG